ncbi:hypothetical protein LguiA_001071 [Lonicera macranthoides]
MMKPSSSSSSSSSSYYKNWKSSSSSSSSSTTSNSSTYYSTFPSSNSFLEYCSLCKQKLLAGMEQFDDFGLSLYLESRGDKAFCSEECRYKQIFMDEEEIVKTDNCSSSAMKPRSTVSSSSSSSPPSRTNRKGAKNRPNGFFAY